MLKVGIVGVDSSHTKTYTNLLHQERVIDAQVVKLFGEDPDVARTLAAELNIPTVVESPEEMADGIDGVIVCNRWGEVHGQFARPFIERGIPTFIDKPMCEDIAEAREIADLARERGTPVISFSGLRWAPEVQEAARTLADKGDMMSAVCSGPADVGMDDPRSKTLFFYGIHCVEMAQALLGPGIREVSTRRTDLLDAVTLTFNDGRQALLNLLKQGPYLFHFVAVAREGWVASSLDDMPAMYVNSLRAVERLFATGESDVPLESTVEILAAVKAAELSAETGSLVALDDV